MIGWIVNGTVEPVGEGGLEPRLRVSVIAGASGRLSVARIVTRGGDEGYKGLVRVDDVPFPLDFAMFETLAFTRTVGFGDGLPV